MPAGPLAPNFADTDAKAGALVLADEIGPPPTLFPLVVNMPVSSSCMLMLLSSLPMVSMMHYHISRSRNPAYSSDYLIPEKEEAVDSSPTFCLS